MIDTTTNAIPNASTTRPDCCANSATNTWYNFSCFHFILTITKKKKSVLVGFTTSRTPSPTPGDPNTSCISGAAGCVCASDGSCLLTTLQCTNNRCQATDPNACQEGTAGCRCAVGDKCTTAKASCSTDKICILPSSGKEPSNCAKPSDIDNVMIMISNCC